LVLEAVAILLGEKTDWAACKAMMVDIAFIDRLKTYDRNNTADAVLRKLRTITNKPEFDPINIGKQSQACKSLCMWCRAIDNYSKIAKVVEPKKKRVAELQSALDVKLKELKVKQDQLQKVKERVARLQKECDETVAFKNKLEDDISRTKNRLVAAERLTEL
jgi:dynein heavy chain